MTDIPEEKMLAVAQTAIEENFPYRFCPVCKTMTMMIRYDISGIGIDDNDTTRYRCVNCLTPFRETLEEVR